MITEVKKAAILLSSLDEQHLVAMLAMLGKEEIAKLAPAVKELRRADMAVLPELIGEFFADISSRNALEDINQIDADIKLSEAGDLLLKKDVSVWDKLERIDTSSVAGYLKKESLQTSAVILSRLSAGKSADILSMFSSREAAEIIDRILNLRYLDDEVWVSLEKSITDDINRDVVQKYADNYAKVAGILDSLKRLDGDRILLALENNNPDAAEKIKEIMFSFEDIITFDDSDIKKLLEDTDKTQVAIALRGTSDKLKIRFFKNMSRGEEKMVKNKMENLGPLKLKVIENARNELTSNARKLVRVLP